MICIDVKSKKKKRTVFEVKNQNIKNFDERRMLKLSLKDFMS